MILFACIYLLRRKPERLPDIGNAIDRCDDALIGFDTYKAARRRFDRN
jgi:hypothetical protein